MKTLTPTTDLFANHHGYSDVHPYEIVRIVSDKCIEIRAMDTSENKTKMNFVAGGFSAHCSNQHAQDYDYTSNPENHVKKIRLNRVSQYCADKVWKCKNGARYNISDEPYKYYDYNF
tara:strand:- start:42 stop:392 length:351 start_codon:yes stop_codon:yes gene_type:complete